MRTILLALLLASPALCDNRTWMCFRKVPTDPWQAVLASPQSTANMLASGRGFRITPTTPCPPVAKPPTPPDRPCTNCPVPDPTPVMGSPYQDCRELVGHSVTPGSFEVANYGKRMATCDGVTVFPDAIHEFAHSGGVTRLKCTGEDLDVRGIQLLLWGDGAIAAAEEMAERECR